MFTLFVIVVILPHYSHLTVEVFFPKKLSLLWCDVIYLGMLGYIVNYKTNHKTKNQFILTHPSIQFSDSVKKFWLFIILGVVFQLFGGRYYLTSDTINILTLCVVLSFATLYTLSNRIITANIKLNLNNQSPS